MTTNSVVVQENIKGHSPPFSLIPSADFSLGSIQKDVASFLSQALEGDDPDQAVIKGLALKTKDVISKLQILRDHCGGQLTLVLLSLRFSNW